MNNVKNKGNIPILLLPLITMILCFAALLSFFSMDDGFGVVSKNISKMSSDVNIMQDYVEETAKLVFEDFVKKGFTPQVLVESASKRDIHLEGQGNFFMKIQNGEFKIGRDGDKVIIEVPGLFIQSITGENSWKREWDMKAEVGINGEFIRFINK